MRRSTVLVAVAVAVLASSCTAWSWGNRYGGGPSTPTEDTPGWIATASSAFHTCRLAADRTARCRGENRFGEVGDGTGLETDDFGDRDARETPTLVDDTEKWIDFDLAHQRTVGIST